MPPGRSSLQSLIEQCGIRLASAQYDRLWTYHGMLRRANAELNLTRIHNFENMVLKHYVDCLLVLKFEELPSPLIDMGSGPGLPGIPLKTARPELEIILAEPRGARAEFLREVVARLGLEQTEVFAGKVGPRFPRRVSGVITRAVASIPETLERVANCLEPGGRMLFMKGPDCDQEIAEAAATHATCFRLHADHAYQIPGTPHDRRLVVYERLDAPCVSGENRAAISGFVPHAGPIREVSSESNPTFKLCRELLNGRGIRKHSLALISGTRPVSEVLKGFPGCAEGWVSGPDGPPPPPLPDRDPPLTWYRLTAPLFQELDTAGTRSPLLLTRLPEIPAWSDADPWPEGCTLFVPFQDPENVGAVIRSAAAFGVARVVLLRESAHPFHPKSVRAGGPALFQVALSEGPSIADLRTASVPLIALDTSGPELLSQPFPDRFGLVVGLEGPGLPDHLRSGLRRSIPMAEGVESLNAATAAAVALYAASSRAVTRPES